ncbi:hypothetical protein [Paraburkholderia sacchari]|nr:hypothetical protein [Paraburkholderia sacchari]
MDQVRYGRSTPELSAPVPAQMGRDAGMLVATTGLYRRGGAAERAASLA